MYIYGYKSAGLSLNKRHLCCDGFFFLSFTLQSDTNYHYPSGEKQQVLTNVKDGGVKCIVLRRRRQQVRERERERKVEIEVLILLRLTRIASEPT